MNKCIVCCVMVVLVGNAPAGSSNLTAGGAQDITLRDGGDNAIPSGGIEVFEDAGSVYILNWRATATDQFWQEISHELSLHNADGAYVRTLASDTTTGYRSFVRKQSDTVYYGLGDDIYSIAFSGSQGTGAVAATLGNNWDMQFDTDGTAFAVANPGWAGNHIYKVDFSGSDNHVKVVADAGAYSAGFAFDSADNLYYGTCGSPDNQLVKFTEQQLDAVTNTPLEMGDGTKITDLQYGVGGIGIDDEDNIVFTLNSSLPSYNALCAIENGKDYSGYGAYGYDVWCSANYWTTGVDTAGNVLDYAGSAGNAAFTSGGGTLSMVPEPMTLMLLVPGCLAVLRRRGGRGASG